MQALQLYRGEEESSSSSDGEVKEDTLAALRCRQVAVAPRVDTSGFVLNEGDARLATEVSTAPPLNARTLKHNPTVAELYGGERADTEAIAKSLRNHTSGFVEDFSLPTGIFEHQYNAFHSTGRAEAPDGRQFGAAEAAGEAPAAKRQRTAAEKAEKAARRAQAGEPPSAHPDAMWRLRTVQPWADKEVKQAELSEAQKEYIAKVEAAKAEKEAAKGKTEMSASTQWHGKQGADWQGRSWLAPAKKTTHPPETCFLPKRWIHTWGADGNGHAKGVNCIRFFPKTGHLLLSAGLDSKIKVWDVHGSGKCMRTYLGHTAGVREANFNSDGSKFVSVAYDKQMHLWDTETGQVIQTIKNTAMFYCATMHPDPAKETTVLAGAGDKKIYQFDFNSGDLVQQYHYHLGAVNTITFLEEGKMFVSTSDDKTLRVWELGVPVQVKVIADPSMHSMPTCTRHPGGKYLCYQSLDSQIVSYNCIGKFRQNRKKVFKGHLVGGNACQVGFSPDGKFIMSGDAQGKLFFWDWTHPNRIVKTIPAHDKVACIGCQWHPLETSKVATCGWDGLIKYWD